MKRTIIPITLALVALSVVFSVSHVTTSAQSSGTYDLTWSTIDGGGATSSSGGTYSLDGTMGQPDAGTMSSGTYSLGGGFWAFAANVSNTINKIFLPLILKNP